MMPFCWLVGHQRRYVGVVDIKPWEGASATPCAHGHYFYPHCSVCPRSVQIARWVCACGAAGEDYIKRGDGIFTVQFGKLVPDEKRWANA